MLKAEKLETENSRENYLGNKMLARLFIYSASDQMKKPVIIFLLLLLIWLLVSIIMLWPPISHYAGASHSACMNGLRQIDGAKQQYAFETGRTNGPVSELDLLPYFSGMVPKCPSGGTYTYGKIEEIPTCSLATNTPPPVVKERVGLTGWRWKVWPSSGSQEHTFPN